MLIIIIMSKELLHIWHLLSIAQELPKNKLVLTSILIHVLCNELLVVLQKICILDGVRHGRRETWPFAICLAAIVDSVSLITMTSLRAIHDPRYVARPQSVLMRAVNL
jgi:hypothetical protein